MYIELVELEVLTASDGSATVYSSLPVTGEVLGVRYVPHATSPLDTGADITMTAETTTQDILAMTNIGTSAFSKAPQQAVHTPAGAQSVFASGGEIVRTRIALANERIKLVVASGGNAKQGTFYVWVG